MQGQTSKKILQNAFQRKLRKTMTDAEKLLWYFLRDHQMAGVKFRRQHPFEEYILDFVCLERKLVIEVDGSQHNDEKEYDDVRTQRLQMAGFKVIRFSDLDVLREIDSVREQVWLEIDKRSHPHPVPPLEGEGT